MSPVGSPRCPHCGSHVAPAGPVPFGAAACASCGRPLWFLTVNGSLAFFRHSDAPFVRRLFHAIPERQGPAPQLGPDSLDVVELVSEFEAALDDAS